jgi:hypothetical protein
MVKDLAFLVVNYAWSVAAAACLESKVVFNLILPLNPNG